MHPDPDPVLAGQESVWQFPRPSIAQPVAMRLRVELAGVTIAETIAGIRTIETSHPPTYYFPRADVTAELRANGRRSFCEWKGQAVYFDVSANGRVAESAAWSYPEPSATFASLAGHIAFYPALMDDCFVDGERATPQPGGFYGGWITHAVAGPFKGGPGSDFW